MGTGLPSPATSRLSEIYELLEEAVSWWGGQDILDSTMG